MYSIYADGVCIYNDAYVTDSTTVVNPKLTLEDNGAGSLAVTLPPSNVGYNSIERLLTDISVRRDGEELWAGRVLSEEKDFWNNRVLYCEGELAFFNDTTQPPHEYASHRVSEFIRDLIEVHNSKVASNRRFTLGAVTVGDVNLPTYYTDNEKTIESLNNLVEQYGGHLRVRKGSNGIRYLDYLKDYPDTCSQTIRFGKNLIDFTRGWDSTEYATVIVPLGKRLDDSPIEELDAYLTVESVNGGSMYVRSDSAVQAYGWIEKAVTWDDVEDPAVLLEKAKAYLADLQFDNMEIELSALDLHYLDVDVESVKLLDEIQVISPPHGLNRLFPVTKLEIPLDSPEKTQFKLGDTVKTSLSSVNNQINSDIMHKIDRLPKAHSILDEAKENATHIMNMATTGYITIVKDDNGSEALYISNLQDYTKADKLWKWSINGLGYSNDGGKNWGTAITMDGSIVADFITTGEMSALRIRGGMLTSFPSDPNDPTSEPNFSLNMEDGTLTMKKGSIDIGDGTFAVDEDGNVTMKSGSISIGTYTDKDGNESPYFAVDNKGNITIKRGSIDIGDGNFTVDEDGNMYAGNAIFAGKITAAKICGDLMSDGEDGWLRGCGISIGGNNWKEGEGNFYVDSDGNVKIKKGSINLGNDNFVVTNDGNVTMAGSITMTGNITWSKGNSPCQVLYARTTYPIPSGKYDAFSDYNAIGWHKVFDTINDYYASYTYDGGGTWTSAIKVRGTDGVDGANGRPGRDGVDGVDGSDAEVTRQNIWRAMLWAAPDDGLYSVNDGYGTGHLLINATAIKTGTIDVGSIYLENTIGGFCSGYGQSDYGITQGAMMYGSAGRNGKFYVIATGAGARMQAGGTQFYVTSGQVGSSEPISQTSDARMKNSIAYDLDRYKSFFQALKPCSYKFNDGTSGRYHIGYIAQDIENAINESGIESTDFAGFVRTKPEEGFHIKLADEYQLRYSEFTALNTYMIQSALREIGRLKTEIQTLRERCKIQNEENA